MPNVSTTTYIALFIIAGVVIAMAIWFGRGFTVRKDSKGFAIGVEEKKESAKDHEVKVGERIEMTDVEAGRVAGVVTAGEMKDAPEKVDVFSQAKIVNSRLGDITGIEQQGKAPDQKK